MLAAILDSENAKPMATSHSGQISSTYQEQIKNAKKWLLPEIAHFTQNMGFCLRTIMRFYQDTDCLNYKFLSNQSFIFALLSCMLYFTVYVILSASEWTVSRFMALC